MTAVDVPSSPATAAVLAPLPDLTPAGLRLLDAASDLFTARGVRAVGVDLVAEVAGTTKKTLYDRFGSKDALVALYLLRRAHRWRAHLLDRLDAADGGTHPALVVLDTMEAWMRGQSRGCAFVNAFAELGGPSEGPEHPAVEVIRAEKAWMRALFDELAGDQDDQDDAGDPGLGAHLHLLYEGAMVVLTAGGDAAAPARARAAAERLLAGRAVS